MDKRIYITVTIVLILAVLALLAYNYFELYPDKKNISPSGDVRRNSFYALEKWLNEEGIPVRVENILEQVEAEKKLYQEIEEAQEKVIVVYAIAVKWENAEDYLIPWIEKGNSILIYMNDIIQHRDEDLLNFLLSLGIRPEVSNNTSENWEEEMPYFNWRLHFSVNEDSGIYTIKDKLNYARLAQARIGEGTLTVTGFPIFMYNHNIKQEASARLSWKLTGEQADENGVLFIRRAYQDSYNVGANQFMARIMERGNLLPIGISALLAIVLGFWMVIPVFGLLLEEKQKSSRPIKERFAAETSFLKKYGALNYYLDTYKRELKLEDDTNKYTYRELINKIRSVYDGKIKRTKN